MTGKVYKINGPNYLIKDYEGEFYSCKLNDHYFKKDSSQQIIGIGDNVEWIKNKTNEKLNFITHILPRKNIVARQALKNKYNQQIIAANIDQTVLLCSLKKPHTPTGFIDRFLVSCELFHIKPILIFNKTDLLSSEEINKLESFLDIYRRIGYISIIVSLLNKEGLTSIPQLLANKISLISGQSGVGKSSFINHLAPKLNLSTNSVNSFGKGKHTTSFSEMYDLPEIGTIIDTPGIKELGIVNVKKNELSQYFPEFRALANECRYSDCLHLNEPNCAIKKAVQQNSIAASRYQNYCLIYDSHQDFPW